MHQLFYILFGSVLTALVSWCGGKLLLRRLSLRLFRQEEDLFAFLSGSACLSLAVFLLSVLHLVYRGVFLGLAILVLAAAARARVWTPRGESLPRMPPFWKFLFLGVWMLFGGLYLIHALAPEASPDGTAYHLALVARYARAHGFPWITTSFYASLPEGIEMLFLFAFLFGRHSAAALVHCIFLLLAPWLILNYGRRLGMPVAGATGGLLVFLAPIAGIDGTTAYNDVALAVVAFSVFALLEIWREEQPNSMLVPIGLLAGFAFAIKYTGLIAAPYAAGVTAYTLWRSRKPVLRSVLLLGLCAATLVLPTLVKNAIVVHNPVSPFLNRVFPNPYVHVDLEEGMSRNMRSYDIHGPWELARDVTTTGAKTGGLLGPVFLLAPLALLALRGAAGRRLLLAALVFLLPYPGNLGSRFLLPAAMFIAPAMALGLSGGRSGNGADPLQLRLAMIHGPLRREFGISLHWTWLAAVLVLIHAFISWPSDIHWYSAEYAYRLGQLPLRAALRRESEDQYLLRRLGPAYQMVRWIERETPPNSRILSLGVPPQAYCTREFLPWFHAALNRRLTDTFHTAFVAWRQPLHSWTAHISPQPLRGLRLLQTGSDRMIIPSIHEMRISTPLGELAPDQGWRFDAHPFPWEMALAFDRNPTTWWSTWRETRAGTWFSVRFGKPETVASVQLDAPPGQDFVHWELQGEREPGKWSALGVTWKETEVTGPLDLRTAAVEQFKLNSIQYLLLVDDQVAAAEMTAHANQWPMQLVAQFQDLRLYHW